MEHRLWMTMSPLRYFLVPADAAWPTGEAQVEDVIGRPRGVDLAALATWEVSPQAATAFLESGLLPLPPPPAAPPEPELDVPAVRAALEHLARDPEDALALLARMLATAGTHDLSSMGPRWEAELQAAGHGELVAAARELAARLPRRAD